VRWKLLTIPFQVDCPASAASGTGRTIGMIIALALEQGDVMVLTRQGIAARVVLWASTVAA
jgi:hypothetical protein